MLRIDRSAKSLALLQKRSLRDAGYWERRDLQQMIRHAPDTFCDEIGESMWFVGEEVAPANEVQDRIDLLAIDGEGAAVIVELKRDNHKLHLLQALSYAAMVAHWQPKRFVEELAKYNGEGQTVE
jgi:RecB family endonuclease NucS